MRILVIIHNQKNTGPFFKIMEMCKMLVLYGLEIVLMCTSKNNHFKARMYLKDGIEIIESPDLLFGKYRQGFDPWNAIARYFILRKQKIDIIHAIDCRPVVILPALAMKFQFRIPLVISWWDFFGKGGTSEERSGKLFANTFGKIEAFFETYFRKYADGSIVISSYLRTQLEELNYPSNKIKLLRVGGNIINTKIINRKKARKQLNLPTEKTVFCYLGSLFERDKLLLLNSLRLIKKENADMPVTILIGNHNLDKKVCADLSIQKTGFLKNSKEIWLYLFAADFGLLPMKKSNANLARWPSKVCDYWASGLPVIATPISDFDQLYAKHSLGFICKTDSAKSYSNILLDAISLSKKQRVQISKSARVFAEKELDWSVIAKKQYSFYKSLR